MRHSSKHIYTNNQFVLSVLLLLHFLPLCKLQNSNATKQVFVAPNALSPVIHSLQLLLNNKTQLDFKSYSWVKDANANLSQLKFPKKQKPSELVVFGTDFFNNQECSLTNLPIRTRSWVALIDLTDDCSSTDVILNILKAAQSINSTMRGILFCVDEIPITQSLQTIANRFELNSTPLYAFLVPRTSVPASIRRCSDTSVTTNTCTVVIYPSLESTLLRSGLWIHRSAQSPPSLSPPPFPRHRIQSSSPDLANQSSTVVTITRAEGSVGGSGGSTNGGVVINVEDAFLNRSSVLFVAVSFILLMFISLAWLVFYYVQRFRYLHSKERASRRLAELARKAVARIPLKLLQAGDKEIGANGEHCAICIEPYRPFDNIRILPCRHYFHKLCIDPWLLEQRNCPMCKLDILQAYDFRPDMDRSCPTSTGGDFNISPAITSASAGPSSNPMIVGTGLENEREEVVVTLMNAIHDEMGAEAVATASVSTSYHDLQHHPDESAAQSRVEWFKGLCRISAATTHYQRRPRSRNMEVVSAEVETRRSLPSGHLLFSEGLDEAPSHNPNTAAS